MNVTSVEYTLTVGANKFSAIVTGQNLMFKAGNDPATENLNLAVFNFLHGVDVRMVNRLAYQAKRGGFEVAAPIPVILVNERLKRAGRPIAEYAIKIDFAIVDIEPPDQTVKVIGADGKQQFTVNVDRSVIRSKSETNANNAAATLIHEIVRLLNRIGVPAKVLTVEATLGLDFELSEVPSGKE